jgi:hypothetical protein
MKDKIYHWCLINLPKLLMWKKVWVTRSSFIWHPRFGFSKIMVKRAEERANELIKGIKWE